MGVKEEMDVIRATNDISKLKLGRVGENKRRKVVFPVADILTEYPGATIGLNYRLPYTEDSYPVVITAPADGEVEWIIGATELQVAGEGECELYATKDDVVVMDVIWKTVVDRSLDGNGNEPEEWEPTWKTEFNQIKGEAQDAAAESEAWATGGSSGTPSATNNAKYYSEQAEDAKEAIENLGVEATTLTPGNDATVTKTVDPITGEVTLTFGIPKGLKGDTGAQGPQGLQGEKGETGEQGPAGNDGKDGAQGQDGEDGISPTIVSSEITGGHRLSITDASGTNTIDVMNGEDGQDGHTPVKGTDYWTAEDKEEIEEYVDDWLEENITNPDSPPLDRSLSFSSAAAPADIVGATDSALIKQIGEYGGDVLPYAGNVPGYISANGDIYSAGATTKEITFNYIPVVPGQTIKYYWKVKGSPWSAIGYWGNDKSTFISRITLGSGTHEGEYYYDSQEIIVPQNAYYFRFSMRTYDDYEVNISINEDIVLMVNGLTYGNLYVESKSVAGYVNTSGSITAPTSAKERTSDYIAVNPGEIYTIQSWATPGSSEKLWIAIGTYNNSKEFITRIGEESSANATYKKKVYTIPQNCKYIRVTVRMYNDGKASVSKGDYAIPYMKSYEDYADKTSVSLLSNSLSNVETAIENSNLFVYGDSVRGYLDSLGQLISASETQKERTSDYIPVIAGKTYLIRVWATVESTQKHYTGVCQYNSSKTFSSRVVQEFTAGESKSTYTYTVPTGISYIKVSARFYSDGRMAVTEGTMEPAYYPAWEDGAGKIDVNLLKSASYGLFNPLIRIASPKIAMHRGASSEAPENTIPAFEIAGQYGDVWGIETDVYETSDGYFILSHDNDVSRMTDGTGNITSMTYAQTQECTIDAGANIEEYSNLKMPLLSDFLKICRKYGKVALPEIKGITHFDNFVTEIRKAGMEGATILQMYYNITPVETLRELTAMPIQLLTMSNTLPVSDLIAKAKKYDDVWISIPNTLVNQSNLESAHSYNLPVVAWTYTSMQDIMDDVELGLDIAIAQGENLFGT